MSGFRAEADMLGAIAASSDSLAGAGSVVVFEVQAAAGVPDIVVLLLDEDVLAARQRSGFLTEPPAINAVMALSEAFDRGASMSAQEVALRIGVTRPYAASRVLPSLRERGLVVQTHSGLWCAAARFASVAFEVVTVEAKLRDWKRGLGQAARHAAGADRSWLVMDSNYMRAARGSAKWFQASGVGLAALDDSGTLTSLVAPMGAQVLPARRELLAERAASLYATGDLSGPVRRVFGRDLGPTTGPDPRLVGAVVR